MRFQTLNLPLLTSQVALGILREAERNRAFRVSLDLGISNETVEVTGRRVMLRGSTIPLTGLEIVAKRPRDIYYVEGDAVKPVSVSTVHFYKLVPTLWGKPPTVEIDGIHMHRVTNITPDIDTQTKMRPLGWLRSRRVLDTCLGLGYTSIYSLNHGARSVTACEVDSNVYWIARLNPWSRGLMDSRVNVKLGDAAKIVKDLPPGYDVIVHDPPRLSLSGSLYGVDFYMSLHRLLKPKGRMIHYVGSPGARFRHKNVLAGVKRRLSEAGFKVGEMPRARSVLAVKN